MMNQYFFFKQEYERFNEQDNVKVRFTQFKAVYRFLLKSNNSDEFDGDLKSIRCHICGQTFNSDRGLSSHLVRSHKIKGVAAMYEEFDNIAAGNYNNHIPETEKKIPTVKFIKIKPEKKVKKTEHENPVAHEIMSDKEIMGHDNVILIKKNDVIMKVGKHKGKSLQFIIQNDHSYAKWVSDKVKSGDSTTREFELLAELYETCSIKFI